MSKPSMYIKFICSSANPVPLLVLSWLVSCREAMNDIFVPKHSNSSTGIQEVESSISQASAPAPKHPALIRANESHVGIGFLKNLNKSANKHNMDT